MLKLSLFCLSLFLGFVIPALGQEGSSVHYDKTESSTNKPVVKTRKKMASAKPSSLALNWRVIRNTTGGPQATNPFQVFHVGDQIQIEITPQIAGYLYVFRETETVNGQIINSPVLVYPDSRIGSGNNMIQSGTSIRFPMWCGPGSQNCWMTLTPPSGVEKFTVILTKSMIPKFLKDGDSYDKADLVQYKNQFQGTRKSGVPLYGNRTVDRNDLLKSYLVQVLGRPHVGELCESIDIQLSTENGF